MTKSTGPGCALAVGQPGANRAGHLAFGVPVDYEEEREEGWQGFVVTAPDDVWLVDAEKVVHHDGERWRWLQPRYDGHVLEPTGQVATSDREVWFVASWLNPDAATTGGEHELANPCADYKMWALRWGGSRWIGRLLPCTNGGVLEVSDSGEMWFFG